MNTLKLSRQTAEAPAFVAVLNPQHVCMERWGDALSRLSLTVCDSSEFEQVFAPSPPADLQLPRRGCWERVHLLGEAALSMRANF